jgi:hypothetical protein
MPYAIIYKSTLFKEMLIMSKGKNKSSNKIPEKSGKNLPESKNKNGGKNKK